VSVDLVTVGAVCADVIVRPFERLPELGSLALVDSLELHLGGLAGVTSTVYCQLGGTAAFMGKLGNDGFGDYVSEAMGKAGVSDAAIQRTSSSGSSATLVLVTEDGERSFLHQLGATSEMVEDAMDYDFIGQSRVFHWGGPAITPGLDGEPMGRVMAKVQSLGVKTSVDTCFDGQGIWLPLIEPSLPHLDLVMSSIEEARHYTGKDSPEAIADFYLSYGPEICLVKLGAEGMYVKSRTESHHLPAHPVANVVDTTGAGDAACAGFIYGYLRDWDLRSCAALANAVGALTVQHIGGAEAIESPEAAFQLMEKQP